MSRRAALPSLPVIPSDQPGTAEMTAEPARKPRSHQPRSSEEACAHHWLLSEPTQGYVPGRCRRCGEERQFPASPDGTRRFDDFQELTSTRAYYREANTG